MKSRHFISTLRYEQDFGFVGKESLYLHTNHISGTVQSQFSDKSRFSDNFAEDHFFST